MVDSQGQPEGDVGNTGKLRAEGNRNASTAFMPRQWNARFGGNPLRSDIDRKS
jgi:hypothetical protein